MKNNNYKKLGELRGKIKDKSAIKLSNKKVRNSGKKITKGEK